MIEAKGPSVTPFSTFDRKYAGLPPVLGQFSDNDSAAEVCRTESRKLAPPRRRKSLLLMGAACRRECLIRAPFTRVLGAGEAAGCANEIREFCRMKYGVTFDMFATSASTMVSSGRPTMPILASSCLKVVCCVRVDPSDRQPSTQRYNTRRRTDGRGSYVNISGLPPNLEGVVA